MEEERLRVGGPQAREPALREVQRAVGLLDARRHDADAVVRRGGRGHALQRGRIERGVRVQEEHERTRAAPPADVAAVGEAAVVVERDRRHPEVGHGVEPTVARRVVDHVDVDARGLGDRRHAFAQVIGAVVGDDDDVHVRHGRAPYQRPT
jgi:hypothetical protein